MKTTQLLWILLLLSSCVQNEEVVITKVIEKDTLISAYDSLKAVEYGADDYGMKTYVMAFLKRGPNRPSDSTQSAELMRAHMDNIGRLAEEGKLIVAGPFYGEGDLRGIYIFDTDNLDSAKAFTETDPAIIHGSLEMELLKWYGSAALMGVPDLHEKLSKSEI